MQQSTADATEDDVADVGKVLHVASPTCSLPLLTAGLMTGASANNPVKAAALVVRSQLRTDRLQRPYVAMTLRCADTSVIEARWWQFPLTPDHCPQEGTVYCFTCWPEAFNGARQLRVSDGQPAPNADLAPFAPAVRRPLAELLTEYEARVAQLDKPLTALVHHILSDQTFTKYCVWPAAQHKHGAMRHGLLAHSLRVAAIAETLANLYGPTALPHDRSLVVAASLLHDIGKIHTLPSVAGTAIPQVASQFDHVTLGALMVQSAADQLEAPLAPERLHALLHAILAHHGRAEWGAPVEPQTVEAWLVHLADYAESRLWSFTDDTPHEAIHGALSITEKSSAL